MGNRQEVPSGGLGGRELAEQATAMKFPSFAYRGDRTSGRNLLIYGQNAAIVVVGAVGTERERERG